MRWLGSRWLASGWLAGRWGWFADRRSSSHWSPRVNGRGRHQRARRRAPLHHPGGDQGGQVLDRGAKRAAGSPGQGSRGLRTGHLRRQCPLPAIEYHQPAGRQPAELDLVVRNDSEFSETGHLVGNFRQQGMDLNPDGPPAPVPTTRPEQRPFALHVLLGEQGQPHLDDGRLDRRAQSGVGSVEFLGRGDAESLGVGDVTFVQEEGAAAPAPDLQRPGATTDGEHAQHVGYGVLDLAGGHKIAGVGLRRTVRSRSGSGDAGPEPGWPCPGRARGRRTDRCRCAR